jgi:hypothetical protein
MAGGARCFCVRDAWGRPNVAEQGPKRPPPRWARHQIVAAYICGVLAIGYFTVQAIAEPLWGVHLDFWLIGVALGYIAALVIFNIKLPSWLRVLVRLMGKERDEDEEG